MSDTSIIPTQHNTVNTETGEIIEYDTNDLMVVRKPDDVMEQAHTVALALKQRIDNKLKPVKFNGETYLEFEDWQLLANFYGITAKVVETKYVEFGTAHGFEARAVAVKIATGQEISGAEALCLNDEPNWAKKPLFQLKSMAQTRASSKVLRNILAWVVVLAGYKPTPAEEMTENTVRKSNETMPEAAQFNEEIKQPKRASTGDFSTCNFGKDKGVKWVDMDMGKLSWYAGIIQKSIDDPSKAKFKLNNQNTLTAIQNALEDKAGM